MNKVASNPSEIWSEHVKNTNYKCCSYTNIHGHDTDLPGGLIPRKKNESSVQLTI